MAVIRTQLEMNSNTSCSITQSDVLDSQVLPKKNMFLSDILNMRKTEIDFAKERLRRANEEFLKHVGEEEKIKERVPRVKFGRNQLCFYNITGEVKDQRILPTTLRSKTALRHAIKKEKTAESKANVLDLQSSLAHLKGDDLINTLDEIRRCKELIAIIENPSAPSFYIPNPKEDPNDALEPNITDEELNEIQNSFEAIFSGEDDGFLSADDDLLSADDDWSNIVDYCGFCCQEICLGVVSTSELSCAICDKNTCVKTCLNCNVEFCADC